VAAFWEMGNCSNSDGKADKGVFQHQVKLAISPVGVKIPSVPEAYHTSVIVDDKEYCFTSCGVVCNQGCKSHARFQNGPTEVVHIGMSHISGEAMLDGLKHHFAPGTYDLLRKNCNSFVDCALFYLLRRRLEGKYRILEQMLECIDDTIGFVRILSMGEYMPNPKANDFNVGKILARIEAASSSSVGLADTQDGRKGKEGPGGARKDALGAAWVKHLAAQIATIPL